jgi:chorismate mutase/prephenate dehydratase
VVPVENSTEGVVNHTLDTFVDSDLKICGEIVVDVHQCLLGRPGLAESAIERVYSHPQALAQCRAWLSTNLARATLVETASTADAARAAASDPSGAAVAAQLAARFYSVDVLRERIQDQADNITRFLVIGRKVIKPSVEAGADKTTVLLVLPDQAGALFHILEPLSEAGINLTKIESRPSKRKAWDYVFFLDLDGHCEEEGIARVLERLAETCQLFKILGSYRKADAL